MSVGREKYIFSSPKAKKDGNSRVKFVIMMIFGAFSLFQWQKIISIYYDNRGENSIFFTISSELAEILDYHDSIDDT